MNTVYVAMHGVETICIGQNEQIPTKDGGQFYTRTIVIKTADGEALELACFAKEGTPIQVNP